MHKCLSYGPDKLNKLPFYHLTFNCDHDLQPMSKNFQVALLLFKENNCAKSKHKCRSYGPDKLKDEVQ